MACPWLPLCHWSIITRNSRRAGDLQLGRLCCFCTYSSPYVAFLLFKGGAQKYDLIYFFGLKQLQTGEEHLLLSDTDEFTETGVFGITRHPWYLGSLLFIWSILPRYPLPVFLAVCILSVYLVVGTMLEERKIVAQYGDSYRRYRKRVSMLFPWKWLMRLLR